MKEWNRKVLRNKFGKVYFVTVSLSEEDRAIATGNMNRKFGEF